MLPDSPGRTALDTLMARTVTNEQQQQLLRDLQSIPSMPGCVARVVALTDRRRPAAADVVRALEADVGLAAKVLVLANSPVFERRARVDTIAQAVALTDWTTVRDVAFAASLAPMFETGPSPSPVELWRHSVCVGLGVRALAEHVGLRDVDQAYAAALLHDIGKFVLLHSIPHTFAQVAAACISQDIPCQEAEIQILGTDHTYIGERVCGQWMLPPRIRACARYHHGPHEYGGPDEDTAKAVAVVGLSDWVAHRVVGDESTEAPVLDWLDGFPVEPRVIEDVLAQVRVDLDAVEAYLGIGNPRGVGAGRALESNSPLFGSAAFGSAA